MRIVHVLLSKNFSGAERHVVELAHEQAKHHDVHVILHAKGFGERSNAIASKFNDSVVVHKVGRPIRQWTFIQVRRLLSKLQPDIAHCHLKAAAKSVRGLDARIKKVATLHIDYHPKEHDHMDALIAITPFQQQRAMAASPAPCEHIDNWVLETTPSRDEAMALRRAHGIDDDTLLIGTVGRVEPVKQHDLLLQAAKPLLGDDVKLAIIGSGSMRDDLDEAHPEVLMPGYSSQPKTWIRGFDVFVNPSQHEAFGLVFLEAMQAGTPVVASASEGAQHLADAMHTTPVAVDDANALREALRDELARGPRRITCDLSRFTIERTCARTTKLYQGLAA